MSLIPFGNGGPAEPVEVVKEELSVQEAARFGFTVWKALQDGAMIRARSRGSLHCDGAKVRGIIVNWPKRRPGKGVEE